MKKKMIIIISIVAVVILVIGGALTGFLVYLNWDSDGDGVSDRKDLYPDDGNEWEDRDDDGFGDNMEDAFPEDPAASKDTDNDGFPDAWNIGMDETFSTTDIHHVDSFPLDPAASLDSDGDSFPDEWNDGMTENDSLMDLVLDEFPDDGREWRDSDGDGYGDNQADGLPNDPAASKDTDGDGYPDEWNEGMDETDSTTATKLDLFPEDEKYHDVQSLGLNFITVPNGSFMMGSYNGTEYEDELPRHRVNITRGFELMKCEVTVDQWEAVMGEENHWFDEDYLPVLSVSWDRCKVFLNKLSNMDPEYTYRFPTEAEWEYACRAGSDTKYYWGNASVYLEEHAWYWANCDQEPHPVGTKKPNPWGFHDMYGNAIEWCNDYYGERYYHNSPENDPQGPVKTDTKVLRGGSFQYQGTSCYSAFRDAWLSDSTYEYGMGFRAARSIVE
jgi:formylglycine-generating enzyme required for sulfatase activity